jgi:hypothetical protein
VKRFLIILGSLSLGLIVFGIGAVAYLAVRGGRINTESKTYVEAILPSIISAWSEKALLDRASPEFKQAATIDQVDRMFRWYSGLGQLQRCGPAQGNAWIDVSPQRGKAIFASYTFSAEFSRGDATINVGLTKHEQRWQISRFEVLSSALPSAPAGP